MRLATVFACALLATAAAAASDAAVTLHYQLRPPYSSLAASGAVEGLVALPAGEALRRAGLTVHWVETPPQRQLALIQGGSGRHCGLGWFRNAEREASGKFSQSLYRDQPFGAIVRSELPIASAIRSSELIADARFAVLLAPGLRRIGVSDLPPGQTRHVYCSRDVPADWLARFDRALAAGR